MIHLRYSWDFSAMNRLIYVLLFTVLLLGCTAQNRAELAVTPTHPSILPSLTAKVMSGDGSQQNQAETTPSATPTPVTTHTLTPTALPTLSPTPYICNFLRGRTESGFFASNLMGEQITILVHLPPCYDQFPDRAFPVLYVFHGWPLDEYHWINLGVDTWADDYVSRSITGPYIIVMPGVASEGLFVNSSGGSNSFEGMVVDELVPYIDASYRTWRVPEARAVGGISRGGVWAIEIALRHQDLFSIVGGHSPALALNRPLPQYDPFRLVAQDEVNLRFYLSAGDRDWARAATITFRDLLEELGIPVTYQVHEGGHVDALWSLGIGDYLLFYADTWPLEYSALPLWSPD
jgi:enterochelin esterase-like enzyme